MEQKKGRFTCALAVTLCLLAAVTPRAEAQVSPDSTALVAIYDALGGDSWNQNDNWKSANPVSSWYGVNVNGSNRVSGLFLWQNNLNGTLPPEFWTLTELESMTLHDNQFNGSPIDAAIGNMTLLEDMRMWNVGFTGSIPVEVTSLANLRQMLLFSNQLSGGVPIVGVGELPLLEEMILSDNQLTGTIPTELGNLSTNLQILDLSGNGLDGGGIPSSLGNLTGLTTLNLGRNGSFGPIPTEIGNLVNLQTLLLEEAGISGPIPASIGNLSQLQNLQLQTNGIDGSIPTTIGGLVQLNNLNLSENQLTGSIPTEIGLLTNLTFFGASTNGLTGSIPTEIGNLINLDNLDLWGNQLTGNIPTSIGNLTQLTFLSLQRNQLDGPIPTEIGNLVNLQNLNAEGNLLTGSIPATLSNLIQLTSLELAENQLTGSIPTGIGSLTNLQRIRLHRNQLSGTLPAGITSLTNLQELELWDNQISGSIPADIGNLFNLGSVNINNNLLTGSIPTSIGNLTNLGWLAFDNNQLTGTIPVEIGNLTQLQAIELGINQLTGSIPATIQNLTNLQTLRLNDNLLSGSFPTWIGNMTNLQSLQLNGNQLTGSIPSNVGNLVNLTFLQLERNQLTGSIPVTLAGMTNLQYLILDDNQLSGPIPPGIANLTSLISLNVHTNQLSGNLPPELGTMINLEDMQLGGNAGLTGSLPPEYGNLTNLKRFHIWDTQVGGEIPTEFGDLINMESFGVTSNLFEGAIPNGITNWTNVQEILVYNNDFTSLPDMSSVGSIVDFDVHTNKLQFGDLEPNIGVSGFQYHDQREIGEPESILHNVGEQVTLSANISGTANQYQWFHDGNPLGGENNADLVLPSVSGVDVGDYTVEVASSIVGGLTLTKAAVTLSVTSDLTITVPDTVEAAGNQILVPVTIGNPAGFDVVSLELKIAYDPAIATPGTPDATDAFGTPIETWAIAENILPGSGKDTLLVAASTADQTLATAGVLLSLIFDIQAVGVPNATPIELVEVLFNDGTPASITTDGSIQIVLPVDTQPDGANPVQVTLVDQETGGTPLTITYDQVDTGGETTMISSDAGETPLPSGFQVPSTSIFFELLTTATFSNNIEICYDYGPGIVDDGNLRLLHYVGSWVDVTTSLNTVNNILCGSVTSFSHFAVGDPTGTDGIVDTDPDPVTPGQDLTITVTDIDEDHDSGVVEFISVLAYDDDNGDTQTVSLEETGISTGIFVGVLTTVYADGGTVAEDGVLGIKAGDKANVDYTDERNATSGTDVKTTFSDVVGGVDGDLLTTRVLQEFDSRSGLRDTVRIEVTDDDGNADSNLAEDVVATVVNSRSGEVETLILGETGLDTGVFQIRVETVTDPSVDEDGKLSILSEDVLSVSYDDLTSSGATATLTDTVDVVNLFGDVQSNDKVQAFDAAFILATAVDLTSTTARDTLLMDVDGDQLVLSADASDVLQYVVRIIDRFEVQNNFTSSQNHPFEKPVPLYRIIALGELNTQDDDTFLVPVNLGDREGVTSATLEIGYGAGVKVVDVSPGSGYGSFMLAHNAGEESVRVAFAGAQSRLTGPGSVLWLEVKPIAGVPLELSLNWVSINGEVLTPAGMMPETQTHLEETAEKLPLEFAFHRNMPNPFNPQTTIRYDVPEASDVRIVVYSTLGQEVRTLIADQREAGRHQVVWNGRDALGRQVATGVYLIRMNAGSFSRVQRVMLLK